MTRELDAVGHTPGPWGWDAGIVPPDGPERYADIYVDGDDTIIARFNDQIPEGRANARLIAAAPDLLVAAKAAKKFLIDDLEEPGRTVFWGLVAAISKAEGRTP